MSNPQLDTAMQASCPHASSIHLVSSVHELVRGWDQELLAQLRPLVQRQSVCLDLSSTERIDAAGLAALVSLYCDACKACHEFAVVNPSRRVARILALVGLDRVLVSTNLREVLPPALPLDMAAA